MEITVIVPIHEYNECAEKAFLSLSEAKKNKDVKTIVIASKEASEQVKFDYDKLIVTEEDESTTFQHMVNRAVDSVDTDYFSILEIDDEYTRKVFSNIESYYESGIDASCFLSLNELFDDKTGEPIGYINESVLATSFSDELGYLDMESCEDFPNYNFTGGVFNTKDFISVGKLKESMKAHFWHEFTLRMLHNGHKIYVIPKVGYHHTINRDGALYTILGKEMSDKEVEFWFDLSKKEYMFKNDRNKTFEE